MGEFFAPQAKKRWCVSQYGHSGRQPTGVFQQVLMMPNLFDLEPLMVFDFLLLIYVHVSTFKGSPAVH